MIINTSKRIQTVKEYYFSKKLKEIAQLNKEGKNIINLGIGSPDLPPPQEAIESLIVESQKAETHSYQSYKGIDELRLAFSEWYKNIYNVSIKPNSEVLPLLGSKEGIFHISMAFLNPEDAVLVPNPGYPAYSAIAKMVGATPILFDLEENNNWQPNLDKIEQENDLSKVKLMWINYPNMPTGANADSSFFKKLIAFGKKHKILICNDNPYSLILNNNPTSILEVESAKEVCIELNSLSKSHNMAGWRVGVIAGKEDYLNAILQISSNINSGMFLPIQKGAIKALSVDLDFYKALNQQYLERREFVYSILEKLNCSFDKNQVGMFVWAKIPDKYNSSKDLSDEILYKKHVFITPGFIFGTNGEKYIRIALCAKKEVFQQVLKNI